MTKNSKNVRPSTATSGHMHSIHDKESTVPLTLRGYANTLTSTCNVRRRLYAHNSMSGTVDLE